MPLFVSAIQHLHYSNMPAFSQNLSLNPPQRSIVLLYNQPTHPCASQHCYNLLGPCLSSFLLFRSIQVPNVVMVLLQCKTIRYPLLATQQALLLMPSPIIEATTKQHKRSSVIQIRDPTKQHPLNRKQTAIANTSPQVCPSRLAS